MTKNIVVDKI